LEHSDIRLPKFPAYNKHYYLVPAQIFQIIKRIENADAISIYMNYFVARSYSLRSVNGKKVAINDIAQGFRWDQDRVADAMDVLEDKGLIERVSEEPLVFVMKFKVDCYEVLKEPGGGMVEKGIPIKVIENLLFPLKQEAVTVLLKYTPMKRDAYGGFAGQLKQLNKILEDIPEKYQEKFLGVLPGCIEHKAQQGEPIPVMKYFGWPTVQGLIRQMKNGNGNNKDRRGAEFAFELKSIVEKKVGNCYRSYQMNSEKNPKDDMIEKAVLSILVMADKKDLIITEDTVRDEVSEQWKKLTQEA